MVSNEFDRELDLKLLVVDDEIMILEILADVFSMKGHDVSIASSGKEAIEILNKRKFDAIISDFRMPNGNGMLLLEFVNSLVPRPLFFFISGQADVSINDCLKAGAKQFFSKPFNFNELIQKVEAEFYVQILVSEGVL